MARPKSCRRISSYPDHWVFKADNLDDEPLEILLSIDEFECIRLIDREGLTQEECAKAMGVSRPTVTDIYTESRKKLAQMLVDVRQLRISGGSYQIGNMKDLPEVPKKGEKQMRIAITYENGNIFQHFGRTENFKLYDVEDDEIKKEQVIDAKGLSHGALAGLLKSLEVDALICGGIGEGARAALREAGIKLYPGVTGLANEAVQDLIDDKLEYDTSISCGHHGHGHHGRSGGRGCGSHRHGQRGRNLGRGCLDT